MLASLLAIAVPRVAAADDKQACSSAYEQTQSLHRAGKLAEARRNVLVCARDSCAEFIRTDCAKWLGEIDASQPTLVFDVRDALGQQVSEVKVELDGQPWLPVLDGKAQPIDPGNHTLRFVLGTGATVEQKLQVLEGEKNRRVSASFLPVVAVVPVPPAIQARRVEVPVAPTPPPPGDDGARPSAGPWILGGVGLASLVAGAVLGGVVLHDKAVIDDPTQCNAARAMCTPAGRDAETQGRSLGYATTATLVVGGAAVAASVVWLVARPSRSRPTPGAVGMGLAALPGRQAGRAWVFRGTW